MSRAELLGLPASVDLPTAGRAFGLGRTRVYELVRTGQFPVRVVKLGNKYRVPTAELLTALGIDPSAST